ncbi:MAG: potassium channel family protein [Methanobacteriaceae archaeon]|nr:potassium channel family protein [Methanobacteriaceae archaeon]
MNVKTKDIVLSILLIIDIIIILYLTFFRLDLRLIIFDTIISIIFLIDIFIEIMNSVDKKQSFKDNFIQIIASIPYDLILAGSGLGVLKVLRFIRLIKILKIAFIARPIFETLDKLNKKTHLDKIVILMIMIMIIGALLISLVEGLGFDKSLYFIIITFSSVGFGDIVPGTPYGEIISSIVALAGVLGIGALSAIFVTWFQGGSENNEITELKEEIQDLKKQNEEILKLLNNKKE